MVILFVGAACVAGKHHIGGIKNDPVIVAAAAGGLVRNIHPEIPGTTQLIIFRPGALHLVFCIVKCPQLPIAGVNLILHLFGNNVKIHPVHKNIAGRLVILLEQQHPVRGVVGRPVAVQPHRNTGPVLQCQRLPVGYAVNDDT